MELAINYSEQAAALLNAGKIRLERFKVPDWPDLIAAARRHLSIYVHFGLYAGADDSTAEKWADVGRMAEETNTPYVNMHLAARAKDFPPGDNATAEEKMMSDVRRAVQVFGAERIIVENIPMGNPAEGFAPVCGDPEAICRMVRESGVGFLLDLSHARLTARSIGADEREYVSRLPVERIRELHLTGLGWLDGRVRDHMPLTDADWEITQWAFEQIASGKWSRPGIVAFEYGGVGEKFSKRCDSAVIAEQIPRLYQMAHEV